MAKFPGAKARSIHRLSSRSGGSAGRTRRATEGPRKTYSLQYVEEAEGGGTRLRVTQSWWMIPTLQQTVYEYSGL